MKAIVLAFAACVFSGAPALADPQRAFSPQSGAEWRLTENRVSNGVASVVTGRIKVVKAAPDELDMEWTTLSVTVGGRIIENNPDLLVGVPIAYLASPEGQPAAIVDPDTLNARASDALRKLGKPISAADAAEIKKFYASMPADVLAGRLLVEPGFFGVCHNLSFADGTKLSGDIQTPNALGGAPILAHLTIEQLDPGSASKPVVIRIKQSLDPASAKKSMKETLDKFRAAKGLLPEQDPGTITQDIETSCKLDYATGEARWIKSSSTLKVGGQQNSDVREITIEPLR